MCLCVTGLTAAAMAELQKLQKMKMMMSLQNGNESDNDDLHSNTGITQKHTQTASGVLLLSLYVKGTVHPKMSIQSLLLSPMLMENVEKVSSLSPLKEQGYG